MFVILIAPMDTMKMQEIVTVVTQNVQNANLPPRTVAPAQQMGLMNPFLMEALVLMVHSAQLGLMLKQQLMCVRLVIQVAFRVKVIKITVQFVQEIYPFYQISAMLIAHQDTSKILVYVILVILNAHNVKPLPLIVVLVHKMELMNLFSMVILALMIHPVQLELMLKQRPMFVLRAIRVALRVKAIKIIVQLVLQTFLSSQAYAMLIAHQDTSKILAYVQHATLNALSVKLPPRIVAPAQQMGLMNPFLMVVLVLMIHLVQRGLMLKLQLTFAKLATQVVLHAKEIKIIVQPVFQTFLSSQIFVM